MSVIDEIAAERKRQMDDEGWTTEHDDRHPAGEMSRAAACYAIGPKALGFKHGALGPLWPWDFAWWKPKSRRHDLVRAGALIVAEIERLDRASADFTK